MPVTNEKMLDWCRSLLERQSWCPKRTLQDYLAAIPRL